MKRRISVAIPARDEADRIGVCLTHLTSLPIDSRIEHLAIIVLANNCSDDTATIARSFGPRVEVKEIILPSDRADAGHARAAAFSEAAEKLSAGSDLLMCTDADTIVSPDWMSRTLGYVDDGSEAVAGLARFVPAELRGLSPRHRRRLALLRRYGNALDYLRAQLQHDEPWPRHFYESGASIALTYRLYLKLGVIPMPPAGEDEALFDAIRQCGGSIRHPLDVRVTTSCRLLGRATQGTSDILTVWQNQEDDEPIAEVSRINVSLGLATAQASTPLTFRELGEEVERARDLVRASKANACLAKRPKPAATDPNGIQDTARPFPP